MNDIIDIGLDNFDIPSSNSKSGGGLEFLMNPINTGSSGSMKRQESAMNLGDLKYLENELNDLSNGPSNTSESKIGEASADYYNQNTAKTWDGYTKMTEVPTEILQTPKLVGREQSKKKRIMLKRLDEWQKKGLIQSTNYNMDSPYEDIEDEYETVMEDKRKQESIKLQKHWFLTGINTIEFFNGMFNPFDLDLTGWGEKMSEDVDDDDELFGELYDKYKGGKLAPEVSLLLRVATSAFLINMTNKMVSSATPGLSDVLKQSPDLMNAFMKATVDSLNASGPATSGGQQQSKSHPMAAFAQDMFSKEFKPNTSQGAPPPPVETKQSKPLQQPPQQQQQQKSSLQTMNFTTRPDLNMAARGVEINQSFSSVNDRSSMRQQPISNFAPPVRQEMKGPSSTDLDSILAGLKKKEPAPPSLETAMETAMDNLSFANDDETVSVISMRDLESTAGSEKGKSYKKRSAIKRKPRSEKNMNSISIDL